MKLHILGACGTFMGGLARLACELGHEVSGSDAGVYPPMSTQLRALGIALHEGYDADQLAAQPDMLVVGNALSRGTPVIEAMLDRDLPYVSGPQWLGEHVLRGRRVIAVAGTHGKTTTASMIARILDHAGFEPGFLIGGVANDFGVSARLGRGEWFVIEADEYDTAFFDKRSKFVHYRPRVAVLNNLELDHADIFPDIASIRWQFHQLLRTVPAAGRLIVNAADQELAATLAMGCWTPVEGFLAGSAEATGDQPKWRAIARDGGFDAYCDGSLAGTVAWSLTGRHNRANGVAAMAAARVAGVAPAVAAEALSAFRGVRRRQEHLGTANGIGVYDDFAHHPTAIRETLAGLAPADGRLLVALDPRSRSMQAGTHTEALVEALAHADMVVLLAHSALQWDPAWLIDALGEHAVSAEDVGAVLAALWQRVRAGDRVVFMSNGGFDGAPARFWAALETQRAPE